MAFFAFPNAQDLSRTGGVCFRGDIVKKSTDSPARMMGLMGTLGIEITAFIIGGVYLGRYLDRHFGTDPAFLIVGIFGGMIVGIASALFTLRSFIKD